VLLFGYFVSVSLAVSKLDFPHLAQSASKLIQNMIMTDYCSSLHFFQRLVQILHGRILLTYNATLLALTLPLTLTLTLTLAILRLDSTHSLSRPGTDRPGPTYTCRPFSPESPGIHHRDPHTSSIV
jgi:hypothetical protein